MLQALEPDTLHGVLVAQAVEVEHRHEQMLVEIRIARAVIQQRVSLERVALQPTDVQLEHQQIMLMDELVIITLGIV